jgi:hypothetical protein
MAAAVAEAHRVLTRGGVLLDVHPSADRPRLLLGPLPAGAAAAPPLGRLDLDPGDQRDFAAAGDALAGALEAGFEPARALAFDYRYEFDSLDDLTDYLDDHPEFARASDELLEQVALALGRARTPARLTLLQRMAVTALVKL